MPMLSGSMLYTTGSWLENINPLAWDDTAWIDTDVGLQVHRAWAERAARRFLADPVAVAMVMERVARSAAVSRSPQAA
ncbi:hypothetical protein ACIHCQ_39635 [Streptomyces sp. NPDC052236]|uniref:hypothetical protein n=1 Tax=Streptomyces sp. NPDC052236 TaxID=3365686 RepID=UPI0037D48B8D